MVIVEPISPVPFTCSCMITVSQVLGTGAPVMIRTACPDVTGLSHTTPAPMIPSTIYVSQLGSYAKAYPSIADL